jgi:hypothetical protein
MLLGLGRHASEHYIGSHPSLRPCEVGRPNVKYEYYQRHDYIDERNFNLSLAPREPEYFGWGERHKEKIRDMRFKEYRRLPGLIFKWYRLYGQVPDQSSWVWKYYVDGEMWRKGVSKYGKGVVDALWKMGHTKALVAFPLKTAPLS